LKRGEREVLRLSSTFFRICSRGKNGPDSGGGENLSFTWWKTGVWGYFNESCGTLLRPSAAATRGSLFMEVRGEGKGWDFTAQVKRASVRRAKDTAKVV